MPANSANQRLASPDAGPEMISGVRASSTSRDRVAISRFTFEMADPGHLDHVINAVRRIDGVFDVYRITGGRATPDERPAGRASAPTP